MKHLKKHIVYLGKVWIDKNKDGINNNEELVSDITVYLYGIQTKGNIDISNKINKTVTDSNGMYKFTGVETGNYVIVFEYNNEIYEISPYQVSTAKSTENSDVISKSVSIDGEIKTCALTDTLTIDNSNLINIDMGLALRNEFNLSLNKYVESIKVTNANGTKVYNYEEEGIVKLEIGSKYYSSSNLEITYKIIISNTGDINGYVNKIVDYIPEGTTIDLDKNDGWYYGEDGIIYYADLVGTEIKVGEQKEIRVTLKKSLSNGEAVTLKNSGEIIETTNYLGLSDIDENDNIGEVSLIILVSTGKIIRNTILILIIMVILVICFVYIYKNYKIRRRIK